MQRYRAQIPVRLVQVGLAAAGTGFFWSPAPALIFLVIHYALYGFLMRAVVRGQRRLDEPSNYRRLQYETGVLAVVIGAHICTLSLQIFAVDGGRFQHVALLLAIALTMLAGLQVHMSRIGFLVGIMPQVCTLLFMAIFTGRPVDPTALFGTVVFILCIVAASWRQQTTDRQATELRVEQASHNLRLQQALDKAEEASRAKSHVLAVASHEIRTPLNVILGLAEGLRREAQNPVQKSYTDGIQRAGAILLRLLNAVLDQAKAEAGQEALNIAPLTPSELAADVISVWAPTARERGMNLVLEVDGSAQGLAVASDFTKIEQTLVNLLSNAIKLSEAGEIAVRLSAARLGDDTVQLRFEVADRGPGVKPEDRERIFAPFQQTDAGTAKGGTGLGLSICRNNVALLGGAIGIEERAGGGAVFWFETPARIAEQPHEAPQAEANFESARPLRILVAEDNAANRQVVGILLEPTGCDITFAENGQEAVDAFSTHAFDLIFMDAMMPLMDGVTAIRHIRAMEGDPRTPIFMLTANVFAEDIRAYEAAGADGVLKKPIQLQALYDCLNTALCGEGEAASLPAAEVA